MECPLGDFTPLYPNIPRSFTICLGFFYNVVKNRLLWSFTADDPDNIIAKSLKKRKKPFELMFMRAVVGRSSSGSWHLLTQRR